MFIEEVAEGVDGDLQELGGSGLAAVAAAERLFDKIFFELVKMRRQVEAIGREIMRGRAV